MSNLPKLLSKIVLTKVKPILLEKRLINENQGAFGNNTIWFKELVLLGEVIQGQYKGKLSTAWLDVKKAFDSVPHKYVLSIFKRLPIKKAIPTPIERIYRGPNTRPDVLSRNRFQRIGSIPLQKGILQGDSLSPLLFILAMQPLIKVLHKGFETLRVRDSGEKMELSYLLYMTTSSYSLDTKQLSTNFCKQLQLSLPRLVSVWTPQSQPEQNATKE